MTLRRRFTNGCQGVERTHFSMARRNSVAELSGMRRETRGKKSRRESAEIFLKEKVLNFIFFIFYLFFLLLFKYSCAHFTPTTPPSPPIPTFHPQSYPTWLCPCVLCTCSLMSSPLLISFTAISVSQSPLPNEISMSYENTHTHTSSMKLSYTE